MVNRYFIILITLSYLFVNPLYAKNLYSSDFNSKSLSSYFSAIISYDNNKNTDALKFFLSSKSLIEIHEPYFKRYILSLVMEGEVKKAINEVKHYSKSKDLNFFEAHLLLAIDSINKKDFKKSLNYIDKLSNFKNDGTVELITYESLTDYVNLFQNKKIPSNKSNFGNLSLINKVFQNCYLNNPKTKNYFISLINDDKVDYSRYIYFYMTYLIKENQINEAKELSNEINTLNNSLLVSQAKEWIDKKKFKKFSQVFSCTSETDVLSEFFFLIANLYSSNNFLEKSNFFLNMSYYLNPKFNFNLSLLLENNKDSSDVSKKILKNFNNKDNNVYYWYKIKKESKIILEEQGQQKSFKFINSKFETIKNPPIKFLFDMANISKNFEKYDFAIKYYNKVMLTVDQNSDSYANLLYRRGTCYERLEQYAMADKDLLRSLEINSNDAYVLNYLAYSWLERGYKIQSAIKMLEKAHDQEKNDPFILDSVGWAYYLIKDFKKAKIFLQKAIILMPDDPVVNDHYGDILWKLNKKIQATYYWKNTLTFENTSEKIKKDIKIKLLKGPKKI